MIYFKVYTKKIIAEIGELTYDYLVIATGSKLIFCNKDQAQ
jgi:NADH dehydrogenase FAD-containing subunit